MACLCGSIDLSRIYEFLYHINTLNNLNREIQAAPLRPDSVSDALKRTGKIHSGVQVRDIYDVSCRNTAKEWCIFRKLKILCLILEKINEMIEEQKFINQDKIKEMKNELKNLEKEFNAKLRTL